MPVQKSLVLIATMAFLVIATAILASRRKNGNGNNIMMMNGSFVSSGRRHSSKDSTGNNNILDGVTYSKLRLAVIDKYHASDPETHNLKEEFKDALQAMSMIENDGLPIPISGIDGLYVGSIGKLVVVVIVVNMSSSVVIAVVVVFVDTL